MLLRFLIVFGSLGILPSEPVVYYNSKYEHIDVEMILNNKRMVNHYAACMLNQGPCPPEGLELKSE